MSSEWLRPNRGMVVPTESASDRLGSARRWMGTEHKVAFRRPVKMPRTFLCAVALLTALLVSVSTWGDPVVIVGDLDDGSARPPAPSSQLPDVEIRGSVTHQLADRKITIGRIADPNPLALPPALPETTEVEQGMEDAAPTTPLFLSATVVDHRATLLRWWHDGVEYRAWSNANLLYLTGFTEFRKGDQSFLPLIATANIDSARLPEDSAFSIPGDLPADPGTYQVIQGDVANIAAFEGVTALHELYQSDYTRLKEAYELREKSRQVREAALRTSPSVPEDIILYYWKMQPQRREGGSP